MKLVNIHKYSLTQSLAKHTHMYIHLPNSKSSPPPPSPTCPRAHLKPSTKASGHAILPPLTYLSPSPHFSLLLPRPSISISLFLPLTASASLSPGPLRAMA